MIAFEARLNGTTLGLAGIDGPCVLTAILQWVHVQTEEHTRKDLSFSLAGLVNESKEDLHWALEELTVGDHLEILVRNVGSVDEPASRQPSDPETVTRESKLRYFEQLKRELFGDDDDPAS